MTWQKIRTHRYVDFGAVTLFKEVYRTPDGRKVPIPWRPGPENLPVVGTRAGWHIRGRKMDRAAWIRADVKGDDDPYRMPEGAGDARWIPGWRPHLYRVDELREAAQVNPDQFVCFPEGEKDADTLAGLGYVAIASSGGAHVDPTEVEIKPLTGCNVVIFADNDDAGNARADRLCRLLWPFAYSVRVVSFPELPKGGDVTDFIEATAEVLR
jgi:hypothetical protein